jgi:hypothetical protein
MSQRRRLIYIKSLALEFRRILGRQIGSMKWASVLSGNRSVAETHSVFLDTRLHLDLSLRLQF